MKDFKAVDGSFSLFARPLSLPLARIPVAELGKTAQITFISRCVVHFICLAGYRSGTAAEVTLAMPNVQVSYVKLRYLGAPAPIILVLWQVATTIGVGGLFETPNPWHKRVFVWRFVSGGV